MNKTKNKKLTSIFSAFALTLALVAGLLPNVPTTSHAKNITGDELTYWNLYPNSAKEWYTSNGDGTHVYHHYVGSGSNKTHAWEVQTCYGSWGSGTINASSKTTNYFKCGCGYRIDSCNHSGTKEWSAVKGEMYCTKCGVRFRCSHDYGMTDWIVEDGSVIRQCKGAGCIVPLEICGHGMDDVYYLNTVDGVEIYACTNCGMTTKEAPAIHCSVGHAGKIGGDVCPFCGYVVPIPDSCTHTSYELDFSDTKSPWRCTVCGSRRSCQSNGHNREWGGTDPNNTFIEHDSGTGGLICGLCLTEITSGPSQSTQQVDPVADPKPAKVKWAAKKALTSPAKGQMTVSLQLPDGAEGLQITYATKSDFSNKKSTTSTSLSKTIKNLSSGKTYYVKVRAYTVNAEGKKLYGKYSAVKKVKVK